MTKEDKIEVLKNHGEILLDSSGEYYLLRRNAAGTIVGHQSATKDESLDNLYRDIHSMLWNWCEAIETLNETMRGLEVKQRTKQEREFVDGIRQRMKHLFVV